MQVCKPKDAMHQVSGMLHSCSAAVQGMMTCHAKHSLPVSSSCSVYRVFEPASQHSFKQQCIHVMPNFITHTLQQYNVLCICLFAYVLLDQHTLCMQNLGVARLVESDAYMKRVI